MAHGNAPIIRNAQAHPAHIAQSLVSRPYLLVDETTETVRQLAGELARAGHRDKLLAIVNADGSGLDEARRAVILSACRGSRAH